MNEKFFSEHRPHDYRLPRSMREAYGYEPVLYEEERKKFELNPVVAVLCVVAWLTALYWAVLFVVRTL